MDRYEEYEQKCEELRKANAELLKKFEASLVERGLSKKTINRHVENVDLLINDYMLRDDEPEAITSGQCSLDGFFYFFIRKCMWSTPANVKTTAASIKKFMKFLADNGDISQETYKFMADDIKESVVYWQEDCATFNGCW